MEVDTVETKLMTIEAKESGATALFDSMVIR